MPQVSQMDPLTSSPFTAAHELAASPAQTWSPLISLEAWPSLLPVSLSRPAPIPVSKFPQWGLSLCYYSCLVPSPSASVFEIQGRRSAGLRYRHWLRSGLRVSFEAASSPSPFPFSPNWCPQLSPGSGSGSQLSASFHLRASAQAVPCPSQPTSPPASLPGPPAPYLS